MKIVPISGVELKKTYKMEIMCGNCETHFWIEIPFGTPKKRFRHDPVCENCGVNEWHYMIEDSAHKPMGG